MSLQSAYSVWAQNQQQDANRALNQESLRTPGYSNLNYLWNERLAKKGTPPDYMQKFADTVNPSLQQFIAGATGQDGGGGFAPIGSEQLKKYGEGMYQLFDKFKPGMEWLAQNQGVSPAELQNMLGTASSGYASNVANQEAQQVRALQRMGVDPTSGAWQSNAGDRAISAAGGLSSIMAQTRDLAKQRDWAERMQAAGIGLKIGEGGTDALSKVAGLYDSALGRVTDLYGNYMNQVGNLAGLNEKARAGDQNYGLNIAQGLTAARPAMDSTFYGNYLPKARYARTGGNFARIPQSSFG